MLLAKIVHCRNCIAEMRRSEGDTQAADSKTLAAKTQVRFFYIDLDTCPRRPLGLVLGDIKVDGPSTSCS